MRFIILVALFGLAIASCPFGNNRRRCFNQLIQGLQNPQKGAYYSQQYDQDDDDEYGNDVDQFQGQPGCFGQQCQDQEYGQDDEDQEEECQRNGVCYQQGGQQQCQPNYQLLQALEQPNCQLAAKLYKQAKQERDDKNTVVSPAAVQLTLAALQKGAQGNTKAQMKRAQCPGLTLRQCQQAHSALIRSLKGTNNVQQTQKPGQPSGSQQKAKINCATGVIVNQQSCAQRQFVESVQKCLGGAVQKCSFKTSPQQCRQQINRLVSSKTCNKVNNMVPQDAVTDNTKMVAVSALQMQAKWARQFRQQQTTKQARFYPLGSQQPKQCQAIQSQGRFNYHENEQVQVVGIPTEQQELTMYVIVPKSKDGLTQVEKEQIQNGQQLKQLLDNCDQQKQYAQVQLPKFQVKNNLDAKKTLLQQGVQDAFDCDQADFTGICNQQQEQQHKLHLNKLIHQATIKVTEQGISSANTGAQATFQEQAESQTYQQEYDNDDLAEQYQQYGQADLQVKANHAFAFAVKHNPSNQIVMVGRVIDACQKPQPQQAQDDYELDQE